MFPKALAISARRRHAAKKCGKKGPLCSAIKARSAPFSFRKTALNCFLAFIVAKCRKIGALYAPREPGGLKASNSSNSPPTRKDKSAHPFPFLLLPWRALLSPQLPHSTHPQLNSNEVLRFHHPRPRALRGVRPGENKEERGNWGKGFFSLSFPLRKVHLATSHRSSSVVTATALELLPLEFLLLNIYPLFPSFLAHSALCFPELLFF